MPPPEPGGRPTPAPTTPYGKDADMTTPPPLARAAALLALLAGAAPARADYFYNWDPTVPTLYSDHSALYVELSDGPQTVSSRSAWRAAI